MASASTNATPSQVELDIIAGIQRCLIDSECGKGSLTNMGPKTFLRALKRTRPKQSLIDILRDSTVTDQKAWEEVIREMKVLQPSVTYDLSVMTGPDDHVRAKEKAKLLLAILFVDKGSSTSSNLNQVIEKWPATTKEAITLKKALRTIENCKCHNTLTNGTFEKAFNPLASCNLTRKPPVPRATFSVPRGSVRTAATAKMDENELLRLQGQVTQLTLQLTNAEAARLDSDEENKTLQEKLLKAMEEITIIKDAAGDSSQLKAVAERLAAEMEQARTRRKSADFAALERKIESALSLAQEKTRLTIEVSSLTSQLEGMQEKLDIAEQQRDDATSSADSLRYSLEEVNEKSAQTSSDMAELEKQISSYTASLNDKEELVAAVLAEKDNVEQKITAFLRELDEKEKALQKAQAERAEESAARKAILEELNTAMGHLEEKSIALEEQADTISGKEAEMSVLLMKIDKLNEKLEKQDAKLKRETESKDEELVHVRNDLAEAEKELEKTRAAQAHAEKIATETKSVFELQAAESARCIAELEIRLVQVQAEKKTVVDENKELGKKLAQTKDENDDVVATFDERIAELEKELKESRKKTTAMEEKLESFEHRLAGAHAENAVQTRQIADLQEVIAVKDSKLSEQQYLVADGKKRLCGSLTAHHKLKEQFGDLEQTLKKEQERFGAELETLTNDHAAEVHELRGYVEELTAKVNEKVMEVAELTDKLDNAELTVKAKNELVEKVETLRRRLQSAGERIEVMTETLKTLTEKYEESERELTEVRAEKEEYKAKVNTVIETSELGMTELSKRYEKKIHALKEGCAVSDHKRMMLKGDFEEAKDMIYELKKSNSELYNKIETLEEHSAAARDSTAKADKYVRAYKETTSELARVRSQVSYLEEELRSERARNNDGARGGALRSVKRRSKSSHDVSHSFVDPSFAFDGSFSDLTPAERMEELKRRNSMYPKHLRSCYPLEDSTMEAHEKDVRCDSLLMNASRHQTDLVPRQPRETFVTAPRVLTQENVRGPNATAASESFVISPPKRAGRGGTKKPGNKENVR